MRSSQILTGFFLKIFMLVSISAAAQTDWKKNTRRIRITSSHTAFPDTARLNGYTYDGKFFEAAAHYSDNTVLIAVPKRLQKRNHVDLIFWFHGWNNNIDSADIFFQLAEQFALSNSNAVLVLAETAKNAPDSYGGKLEQPNVFAGLVNDVLAALKKGKCITSTCNAGNIILAGHSGAYRTIAYILQNGGVPVREVELFDALYSQTDKFINWIQKDSVNRFIHWYTNHGGGTDEVSVQMMDTLRKINIPFVWMEEKYVTAPLLQSGRILFIHSTREHNDIINNPGNFKLLLTSTAALAAPLR
jgi:hypothetical protein